MERIQGVTVQEYIEGGANFLLTAYNTEKHSEQVRAFVKTCLEVGWFPRDTHNENVMITPEGRFYIIDYGYFITEPDEHEYYDLQDAEADLHYHGQSIANKTEFARQRKIIA